MKSFAEARLGRTVDNSGREKYLKYSGMVLCFDAEWDDTASLYGEVHRYNLHYFLADDTVEICTVKSKRQAEPPHLLKRSKLPKSPESLYHATNAPEEYVRWTDLFIGANMWVYGRNLVLTAADKFTQAWYEGEGLPLDVSNAEFEGDDGMMSELAAEDTACTRAPKDEAIVLRYSAELESAYEAVSAGLNTHNFSLRASCLLITVSFLLDPSFHHTKISGFKQKICHHGLW